MTTPIPAGWKPIESAPEGVMILCANMNAMEARDWAFVAWMASGKVCGHRMDKPTHWMPLPAEPCLTCNGHGMIGGLTPHSGYDAEPCPDCSPPAPTSHPIPTGATGEDGAAPSLSSLRGFAPGACDGMKSEDYVNKVRNGDWSSPHCTPAPSAPGDAQDERQAFEAWAKKKKMPLARIGQQYDDFWVDHAWNGWKARASVAAPAAGDELDAQRWRFIRRKLCLTGNGDGTCAIHAINLPASVPGWPEPGPAVAEFCDAAIDAEISSQQGECGAA